jgi:hypothetical protein
VENPESAVTSRLLNCARPSDGAHLSILKPGDVDPLARDLDARIAAI